MRGNGIASTGCRRTSEKDLYNGVCDQKVRVRETDIKGKQDGLPREQAGGGAIDRGARDKVLDTATSGRPRKAAGPHSQNCISGWMPGRCGMVCAAIGLPTSHLAI